MVCGCKQTDKHTHTIQCSSTSVGLTQACLDHENVHYCYHVYQQETGDEIYELIYLQTSTGLVPIVKRQ